MTPWQRSIFWRNSFTSTVVRESTQSWREVLCRKLIGLRRDEQPAAGGWRFGATGVHGAATARKSIRLFYSVRQLFAGCIGIVDLAAITVLNEKKTQ